MYGVLSGVQIVGKVVSEAEIGANKLMRNEEFALANMVTDPMKRHINGF
jgi:hypothetical protein